MNAERDALRPLALARVTFGTIALVRMAPVLLPIDVSYLRASSPLVGWPAAGWHVAVGDVALPSPLVAVLCVAHTIAAAAFVIGVFARASGIASAVLGALVLTQDAFAYINTLELLCAGTLVLAVSGSASSLAVIREPPVDPPSALGVVRAFVASVYVWSGIAKLNASWLSGAALQQHLASGAIRGAFAGAVLRSPAGCAAMATAMAVFELALGPLLLWPRTRTLTLGLAVLFHITLEGAMHPDVFGLAMIALLVSFTDRRTIGFFGRSDRSRRPRLMPSRT